MIRILVLGALILAAAACTPAPTELPKDFDASFDF